MTLRSNYTVKQTLKQESNSEAVSTTGLFVQGNNATRYLVCKGVVNSFG